MAGKKQTKNSAQISFDEYQMKELNVRLRLELTEYEIQLDELAAVAESEERSEEI